MSGALEPLVVVVAVIAVLGVALIGPLLVVGWAVSRLGRAGKRDGRDDAALCAACPTPGVCCRGFALAGRRSRASDPWLMRWLGEGRLFLPLLPFRPLPLGEDGIQTYWCPRLGADGRCTSYRRRPAVCREFRPGSGPLCLLSMSAASAVATHRGERRDSGD